MAVTPAAAVVPLFPLPNLVLLPRVVLPLHIFEHRYRRLAADALDGDKRIAMALLQPGWEAGYAGRPPLEPAVCVGTIVAHEVLADGRYNLLLRGDYRGRIARELSPVDDDAADADYRSARIEPIAEPSVLELDLEAERRRLAAMFAPGGRLSTGPGGPKFRELLASAVPTADAADLIAFHLVDDVPAKQHLLAEADPRRRVLLVLALLANQHQPPTGPTASDGRVDVNLN